MFVFVVIDTKNKDNKKKQKKETVIFKTVRY